MGNFTDTDIAVLATILRWHREQESSSMTNGCQIDFISNHVHKSTSRLRQSIKLLLDNDMITEGIKKGLKKTYIITPIGVDALVNVKKNVLNDK